MIVSRYNVNVSCFYVIIFTKQCFMLTGVNFLEAPWNFQKTFYIDCFHNVTMRNDHVTKVSHFWRENDHDKMWSRCNVIQKKIASWIRAEPSVTCRGSGENLSTSAGYITEGTEKKQLYTREYIYLASKLKVYTNENGLINYNYNLYKILLFFFWKFFLFFLYLTVPIFHSYSLNVLCVYKWRFKTVLDCI